MINNHGSTSVLIIIIFDNRSINILTTPLQIHPHKSFLYYTLSDGSVKRCIVDGKDCKTIYTPTQHKGTFIHAVTSDPRVDIIYLASSK